ncbi:hypothetical protein MycrhDRAFT_5659 [Mycolicibacterium rhodesiae JS60]|nr:hypothetical protein MycrhDRAFT_5659 [Mycolicibacterium rhodesiae JS60]
MDRDIISPDRKGILGDLIRDQIPVITDPVEAESLLAALIEALSSNRNVQAEFRAGAIWERKGRDDGGDLSPLVSPSPYRDSAGSDEVYLSVSVRIGQSNKSPAVKAFVETRRAQSEQDRLAELESEAAARRNALNTDQSALEDLEARAAELRAATGR